jgi:putative oxidoreductase
MTMKQVLFGGVETGSTAGEIGRLVLRVFAGLALALAHGLGKVPPSDRFVGRVEGMGFPAPELFAWLAAFAEFGGGLLLAAGLLTRPIAAYVAAHFVIVVALAHAGDPFGQRELPLFFLAVAIHYMLMGGGRYSLDSLIRRR